MCAYQITSSAELMENYLQADFLEPQDKFIALQTDDGSSLLFSIGTDKVLYLTEELQGEAHGWTRTDLSSAQIKQDFPGGATCKTFAAAQQAAQQAQAAEIHLAMVANDGANDHLYLSLGNSDADPSWASKPAWTACPFNATHRTGAAIPPPAPFEIAGVFISEATDKEYVVVDLIRNPTDPVGVLRRFYIDLTTPSAPRWTLHDLAEDIEAAAYSSCLGRNDHAFGIDGLYTAGTIDGSPQLIYTPLFKAFDPAEPPAPSRLSLAGGVTADAIAAVRNADNSSDLYAVGQGGLYYLASSKLRDKAVAPLLFSNDLLTGVRALFAYAADGKVTVWGLNGNDDVFYATCDQGQAASGAAWTRPIIILTAVDAISPYIDRQYSANTFFAHSAGGLVKAVKSPTTGLWSRRNITLPPLDTMQDPTRISSYTTRIQVTGDDGQGAAGVPVTLTAASVTSVYINHLYYRVGPSPIVVATDPAGSITIVETAHMLAAARFTAAADSQALDINPMDAPFQRSAKLDSASALQNAVIANRDGTTRPFIPAGTSQADLNAVATSNQGLGQAYAKLAGAAAPAALAAAPASPTRSAFAAANFEDGLLTDLGDLYSWLESGVDAVVSVIEDAAEGVWHFVAEIAGQVYHGILDCVEKVVAAAMWIYNAIKVLIEDILLFLEFLFEWQDIVTTHRVFKNVFTQFVRQAIDGLGEIKSDLPGFFGQIEAEIDTWAGIPDFSQTPGGTAAANPAPAGQNSAPSHLGIHHFQGNVASASAPASLPSAAEAVLQDLLDLLAAEEQTIVEACAAIKADIIDEFSSLSVSDIVKKIAAILADTLLESAKNILTALLDVLVQLADGVMDLLTATIDIPVLSWLYNELVGDELSFLDLICLIAAIPATLIFKCTADAAPFPRGDAFTDGLIGAASFAGVRAQFAAAGTHAPARRASRAAMAQQATVLDQAKLKDFAAATGFVALAGSLVLSYTSIVQKALDLAGLDNARPKLLATISAVGNVAYVSPNLSGMINWDGAAWSAQLNNALTSASLVKAFVAIPFAASTSPAVQKAFPATETFINLVWNVPVICNLIANKDACNTTYKSLIPESIGNFAFNLGGTMELPIALIQDPKAKLAAAAGQIVLMLIYGTMASVAGGIYGWAPNQEH